MERTLFTERIYSLGDYKNIKFNNTLAGIPEELANNTKAIELLFTQQFLSCEIAYRKYYDMMEKIAEEFTVLKNGKKIADTQAIIEFLQGERETTMSELYEEIKKVGEAKETSSLNKNEKETV